METIKIEGSLVFMDQVSRQKFKEAAHLKDVELDFAEVEAMDSCGVDLLIKLYKDLIRKGGSLRIINVSEPVMNIFRISGMNKIIDITEK